jgi:hypothetical protein
MRAAQNSVDLVNAVSSAPAALLQLIADLPAWLRAAVVVVLALLLVAGYCVPRLLRAIDDHMLVRKARDKITKSEDWVEVLRIRNEPRRMFGRATAPEPPAGSTGTESTESRGGAGRRSDEDGGTAADEPP